MACEDSGRRYREVDGAAWTRSGDRWCRWSADGRLRDVWEVAPSSAGALRLIFRPTGQVIFAEPLAIAEPAERADRHDRKCVADPRMRRYIGDNRVIRGETARLCHIYGDANLSYTISYASAPQGDFPLLTFNKHSVRDGKTLIMVGGGPFTGSMPGLDRLFLTNHILHANNNISALLVPGYLGTDPVEMRPTGDIVQAEQEIRSLIDDRLAQGQHICVIGGSLGGYIAGALARHYPNVGFLLINPLIASPRSRIAAIEPTDTDPAQQVVIDRIDPANGRVRRITLPLRQAVMDYFGPYRDRTLAAAIGGRAENITLLAAAHDDRVGIDAVARVASALEPENAHILERPTHAYEEAWNYQYYTAAVDNFLKRC